MALLSSTIVGLLAFLAAFDLLQSSNYVSALHIEALETVLDVLPVLKPLLSPMTNVMVGNFKKLVPSWFSEENPMGLVIQMYADFFLNPKPYEAPFPECNMKTPELIEYYNYPAEIHNVTTKDGYILQLHRIPNGKGEKPPTTGEPILLQHGFACSSSDWVINPPDQSLGFQLADRKYDVWLGNIRGNTYSRRHANETMDLEGEEYWNFSVDEIAGIDITTMIDYVLNTTNRKQLTYIGHSMGTMDIFALLSSQPEYNQKVKQVVALGPASSVENVKSILSVLLSPTPTAVPIQNAMKLLGWYYLVGKNSFYDYFAQKKCSLDDPFHTKCVKLLELVIGKETNDNFNMTRLPHYMSHMLNGFSMKMVEHSSQTAIAKRFQKFDYGFKKNMEKYNQAKPPEYELKNIQVPVTLAYGTSDLLTVPDDVDIIYKALPKEYRTLFHVADDCNHMDLLWGQTTSKIVNKKIFELLDAKKETISHRK